MKKPTGKQVKMHDQVCSQGWTIAHVADAHGVSKSTVRRALDAVTEYTPKLEGYDLYITKDVPTLKKEIKQMDWMIAEYRTDLETAIRCGRVDNASRYAARLARYTDDRAACARAHDIQVWEAERAA